MNNIDCLTGDVLTAYNQQPVLWNLPVQLNRLVSVSVGKVRALGARQEKIIIKNLSTVRVRRSCGINSERGTASNSLNYYDKHLTLIKRQIDECIILENSPGTTNLNKLFAPHYTPSAFLKDVPRAANTAPGRRTLGENVKAIIISTSSHLNMLNVFP